jgi:hypothetical protein
MVQEGYVQVEFLIPTVRDGELSDGRKHPTSAWHWLDEQLWTHFGGATVAPGLYSGFYRDPDTGERIHDKSRKYIVALPGSALDDLRILLKEACWIFQQKCIYLSIAGHVEFIELPPRENHENQPEHLP